MEIRQDLAPPSDKPLEPAPIEKSGGRATSTFSQRLAEVEGHRTRVQATLAVAIIARLLFEFQFVSLLRNSSNMLVQVPYIGLALLSYLLVLMWLAGRTRDRFGFGMALGIGVLEATYLMAIAVMQRPFDIKAVWAPIVVALAHIPMAIFAFKSSQAYPPLDSKRPWIVGFVTSLVFLAIPWVAPSLVDAIK
jgi:hypothetical protein